MRALQLDPFDLMTAIHEYWHYHVDSTTASGWLGLVTSLQLMGHVSSTIDLSRLTNWFRGDAVLTPQSRNEVALILDRLRLVDGAARAVPNVEVPRGAQIVYDSVSHRRDMVRRQGPSRVVDMPRSLVDIEYSFRTASSIWPREQTTFQVGAYALDESGALLVEQRIAIENEYEWYDPSSASEVLV